MEDQLFSWEGWDQQDTMAFTFYNTCLKVDIGDHKAGSKFDSIDVDYENGTLTMCNYGEAKNGVREIILVGEFKLELKVIV